jgi:hypothetical protein
VVGKSGVHQGDKQVGSRESSVMPKPAQIQPGWLGLGWKVLQLVVVLAGARQFLR